MRITLCLLATCMLTACTDTTPINKTPHYDQASGQIIYPKCPDWSQPSTGNTDNSVHSNFGCAAHRNLAVQLENPADLARGHGAQGADTEATITTITRYRKGEIPEPLTPQASNQ